MLKGGVFFMAEKKDKRIKGRYWTMIVYPESAPENWRDILDQTHLEWVESPLHDSDVNPDGSKKKPHWHIMLCYEGPATQTMVQKIADELHSPRPQKVGSAKGMVRYFAHLDNPEKFRYKVEDIVPHNGADIGDYFKLTSSQNLAAMKQILKFIKKKEITNYIDFLDSCLEYGNDDWFDIAINRNTMAVNKMLDAMWQKKHGNKRR